MNLFIFLLGYAIIHYAIYSLLRRKAEERCYKCKNIRYRYLSLGKCDPWNPFSSRCPNWEEEEEPRSEGSYHIPASKITNIDIDNLKHLSVDALESESQRVKELSEGLK